MTIRRPNVRRTCSIHNGLHTKTFRHRPFARPSKTLFPQAIAAAGHKLEISVVSEELQLLTNLRSYISVVRVQSAQFLFEGVDLFDVEIRRADHIDTSHYFN